MLKYENCTNHVHERKRESERASEREREKERARAQVNKKNLIYTVKEEKKGDEGEEKRSSL